MIGKVTWCTVGGMLGSLRFLSLRTPGVSPGRGPREGPGRPAAPLPAEKRGPAHTPRKAVAGFHQPAPPGAAAGGPAHSFPVPEGRASADLVDVEGDGPGLPLSNLRRDWAEEAGGSHFSPYKPPPGPYRTWRR